jgi:predicted ATPase
LHDRVQQAAYSLVPPETRNQLHYAIGRRLCAGLSDLELADQAFDLAAHLNAGVEDVSLTLAEREHLARINLLAGQKALRVSAARSAVTYLITGRDLLGPSSWSTAYELASATYTALVDAEYASSCAALAGSTPASCLVTHSNYVDALAYAEYSIQHVQNDLERLQLYSRGVRCATGTGDPSIAVRIGFDGLRCAGIDIPLDPEGATAYADALVDRVVLDVKQIGELAKLPKMQAPVLEEAQAVVAALGALR